jgi:hypothetical protein
MEITDQLNCLNPLAERIYRFFMRIFTATSDLQLRIYAICKTAGQA